jgi:hypothetical protein
VIEGRRDAKAVIYHLADDRTRHLLDALHRIFSPEGLATLAQAKVMVLLDHVAQEVAHHPRRLAVGLPGGGDRDRVIGEVRHHQIAPQQPAVGVRVCAHPPVALGC